MTPDGTHAEAGLARLTGTGEPTTGREWSATFGGVVSWDDIDKWAEEQRKRLAPTLRGPAECAETGNAISADRMRTMQANHRIQRGFHPFGMRLLEPNPSGETCGTCKHLLTKEYAGRYFKCAKRGDTNGPATDCRKKWPACELWEAA